MMAAGLFCALRRRFAQRASSARVARLVKASFAVYLIHMAFVMAFRQFGFDLTVMPPLLAVPVLAACVLALSLAGAAGEATATLRTDAEAPTCVTTMQLGA